jgi:hypothetical protein
VTVQAPTALVGAWRLRRRLVDRSAGGLGTMTGTLTLEPDDGGLAWHEAGRLRWAGRDLDVTRDYVLRENEDGWWVHFTDGRPFHPWRPGATVEHPCVADLYRGLIRIDGPDRWRILWDVTGPRKEQRILSRLVR